jgi:hypothetical protein
LTAEDLLVSWSSIEERLVGAALILGITFVPMFESDSTVSNCAHLYACREMLGNSFG